MGGQAWAGTKMDANGFFMGGKETNCYCCLWRQVNNSGYKSVLRQDSETPRCGYIVPISIAPPYPPKSVQDSFIKVEKWCMKGLAKGVPHIPEGVWGRFWFRFGKRGNRRHALGDGQPCL
jgi:hypothetical protein